MRRQTSIFATFTRSIRAAAKHALCQNGIRLGNTEIKSKLRLNNLFGQEWNIGSFRVESATKRTLELGRFQAKIPRNFGKMTEIETFSRLDNAAAKQDLHSQLQKEFWKEERRTQLSDMTSSRNLYTRKKKDLWHQNHYRSFKSRSRST